MHQEREPRPAEADPDDEPIDALVVEFPGPSMELDSLPVFDRERKSRKLRNLTRRLRKRQS